MQLSKWAALGYRRASWNLATWWKYLHLRSVLYACTSMHVQELLAHIQHGSYVYLGCVYGHEVRYCQIAWHVVSMYSIVSSVTACEITWFRSDGYDPTYPFNQINNPPTNWERTTTCHSFLKLYTKSIRWEQVKERSINIILYDYKRNSSFYVVHKSIDYVTFPYKYFYRDYRD